MRVFIVLKCGMDYQVLPQIREKLLALDHTPEELYDSMVPIQGCPICLAKEMEQFEKRGWIFVGIDDNNFNSLLWVHKKVEEKESWGYINPEPKTRFRVMNGCWDLDLEDDGNFYLNHSWRDEDGVLHPIRRGFSPVMPAPSWAMLKDCFFGEDYTGKVNLGDYNDVLECAVMIINGKWLPSTHPRARADRLVQRLTSSASDQSGLPLPFQAIYR